MDKSQRAEFVVIKPETGSKAAEKRFNTLDELFAASGYHGFYQCQEYDWGPPVGEEVW